MAKKKIKAKYLSNEINKILEKYGENVNNAIALSVESVAKNTVQMLKTSGDYKDRTGDYRNSFQYGIEKTYRGTNAIIFSDDPDYRLTHLLENGHMSRDGTTKVEAFPHWKPAEQTAIKEFEEELIENIQEVGK